MKRLDEAPATADVARPVRDTGEIYPAPSDDQQFFDESLRASVRSLGRLIRGRRKSTE